MHKTDRPEGSLVAGHWRRGRGEAVNRRRWPSLSGTSGWPRALKNCVESCFICAVEKLSSWTAAALTTLKMPAAFSFNTSGQSFVFYFFIPFFLFFVLVYFIIFFVFFFSWLCQGNFCRTLGRPLEASCAKVCQGFSLTLNSFWFSRRLVSSLCRFCLYIYPVYTLALTSIYTSIPAYIYICFPFAAN